MTKKNSIKVKADQFAKDLVVKVEIVGLERWKLRVAFGLLFIRLGVWVTGMQCKINAPVQAKKGFR